MQSRYSFSGFSNRNACGFTPAEDEDAVVKARRNMARSRSASSCDAGKNGNDFCELGVTPRPDDARDDDVFDDATETRTWTNAMCVAIGARAMTTKRDADARATKEK
jgi:hypothetical protein